MPEQISWETLELFEGSSVDEELRQHHSDLLFTVELAGRRALLYFLVEHKSGPDVLTSLQLLVYITRIWRRCRKKDPGTKTLPIVIPIVVYHGEDPWPGDTEHLDVIDIEPSMVPILGPHIPNFRFVLDDLSVVSSAELQQRTMADLGRLALFCLKRARHSGDLLGELCQWVGALRTLIDAPTQLEAHAALFRYIMHVTDVPSSRLQDFLEQEVGSGTEKLMKTTAEQLEEKGMSRILLKQLEERFGALPRDVIDCVRNLSAPELLRRAKLVLTAETLEAVLADA